MQSVGSVLKAAVQQEGFRTSTNSFSVLFNGNIRRREDQGGSTPFIKGEIGNSGIREGEDSASFPAARARAGKVLGHQREVN